MDSDLYNEKKANPDLSKRRQSFSRSETTAWPICKIVSEPTVFLVSNFEPKEFDFPKLQETLLKDLPAEKRYITLSVANFV